MFMLVLTAFAASCSTGKTDDQKVGVKPGMLNDFIIMAYSGPPPEEVNLERYQEIADSGIDYLVPANGAVNAEQNLQAMELGAQVGVGIIPVDLRLFPFELKPGIEADAVGIKAIVKSYKDHPALAAYVVKDEPNANLFPALKEICDVFRVEDPGHPPLINLFPSYGSPVQLGFADYRAYVASFIEIVEPELLSYDYYPLRNEVTMYDGWFNDLSIAREEAQRAGIPFLVFIQSEGIKGYLRVPNRAEILWQVNTVLAYGAQGIGWFCYWTPAPDQGFHQAEGAAPPLVEKHYNAMIDINGNRTEVYDYVREANLYLKKAGRGLLGWESTDVARYEAGKMIEGGASPIVVPNGNDANIVVGTFRKDGRIRLVISNARCDVPAGFSLKLSGEHKIAGVFSSIDADPAGKLEWNLKPGGSIVLDMK